MDKSREDTRRRIQDMSASLRAAIATARELREMSQNLRQENADLREFLRETLLASFSTQERLRDK